MTPTRDGERIYVDGEVIGTIHRSVRSKRWYFKRGPALSPARYFTPEGAETALREAGK